MRRQPAKPFYVYINYFDAHNPYLPPAPYNHRFGTLPESVVRRWGAEGGFRPKQPLPAADRQALVDGYDNSLAYLDAQIGRLVRELESSPAGKNTIFMITADHGEAFGEHGAYQHGNDLHWEEIHVPLIVYGAGIPVGKRIEAPVPNRKLFSTVIDLALGHRVPMHAYSLARYWQPNPPQGAAPVVVSELSESLSRGGKAGISLTTAQWHYILTTRGSQYLYSRADDRGEMNNLSSNAQDQPIVAGLNIFLREIESKSAEPWAGPEYLVALVGGSSAPQGVKIQMPSTYSDPHDPAGEAQSYFYNLEATQSGGPSKSERELLQTLPYQ